jgi:hypothetical protein
MKNTVVMSAIFFLMAVGLASATEPTIQGRWEFAITSGATEYQLDNMGQPDISTVLLQTGNTLTNIPIFTFNALLQDVIGYNNVTASGTIDEHGCVSITFTVGNGGYSGQSVFNYVFTGKLGKQDEATVITGTYTTTESSTYSNGSGNFTATFFPDFTGALYQGMLIGPDNGPGPSNIPFNINPTTNPDHSVSGTVNVFNFTDGQGNACFAGPLTMIPGLGGEGDAAFATGVFLDIIAKDSAGNLLWLNTYSVEPDGFNPAALNLEYDPTTALPTNLSNAGTNNEYAGSYSIIGGPCDGVGGGDISVQLVKNHKHPWQKIRNHHPRQEANRHG